MPVVFSQKKKIQKSLIIVLGAVFLITGYVVWNGFFKEEKAEEVSMQDLIIFSRQQVNINFDVFKDPFLEDIQPFIEINPISKDQVIGSNNPFLPYPGY